MKPVGQPAEWVGKHKGNHIGHRDKLSVCIHTNAEVVRVRDREDIDGGKGHQGEHHHDKNPEVIWMGKALPKIHFDPSENTEMDRGGGKSDDWWRRVGSFFYL